MGRRPIPTAIHQAAGTYRPDRHGPPARVAPAPQVQCPRYLDGDARDMWMRTAPLLRERGLLTQHDVAAFERLCQTYAEIRHYDTVLAQAGYTYTTPLTNKRGETLTDEHGNTMTGMQRPRPEVAARDQAEKRLKAYLIEFGLTPAARGKVMKAEAPPDEGADDPVSQFLS